MNYRARTIAAAHWFLTPSLPKALILLGVFLIGLRLMPDAWRAEFDPIMLLTLGVMFTYLMINLIRETRSWTMRGLGILFTFMGDALLYLSVSTPHWEIMLPVWTLDLARAAFAVGIIHLVIGSLDYELHKNDAYEMDERQDAREVEQNDREQFQDDRDKGHAT